MQGTRTLQCIVCVVFGITLTVHMNTAIFPTTPTLLITDTKTAELYSSHRNALPFRDRLKCLRFLTVDVGCELSKYESL